MTIDMETVLRTFVNESTESLAEIEEGLLDLEANPEDREALDGVFRLVHSLKGNAACLGFQELSDHAHAIEHVLDRFRENETPPTPGGIGFLIDAIDSLRRKVERALDRGAPSEAAPNGGMTSQTEGRCGFEDRKSGTLRVPLTRLDSLLDLVGEISVARARLAHSIRELDLGAHGAFLLESLHAADDLHLSLQEQVLQARLVPLEPAFAQLRRVVRDLSRELGKSVRLETSGGDIELDKELVDGLRDPLTHLVRNAVDHGLETEDERRGAGKDPTGRLMVSARREANGIVLVVEDDGRGLDLEGIGRKAVDFGLQSEGTDLDSDIVLEILCRPGFSTREKATEVSGRGVGLDVVRRRMTSLHGALRLDHRLGGGSRWSLQLPLTVAIVDALMVESAHQRFLVPLEAVSECVDLPRGSSPLLQPGVLPIDQEEVPYAFLHQLMALEAPSERNRESVVVLREGDERAGLVVDRLLGRQQTVIKPLTGPVRNMPGLAGAAILGDGQAALILEPSALVRQLASR